MEFLVGGFPVPGETIFQTGEPAFPNIDSSIDVVGEHLNPYGAEQDHQLLIDRLIGDRVPALEGQESGLTVNRRLSGWVPYEYLLLARGMHKVDLPVSPPPSGDDEFPDLQWFAWPDFLEHIDVSTQLVPVNVLLANTNINTPSVDVIASVTETLKDLPTLIHSHGKSLLDEVGGENLRLQFGWKPLLADVREMVNFGKNVSKRLTTLQRLIKGAYTAKSRIERQSEISRDSFSIDLGPELSSDDRYVMVDVTRETVLNRWGCVTYTLPLEVAQKFAAYSADKKFWEAVNSTYNLNLSNPATLWELIPWSWAVDWFAPITDVLLGYYNNRIPVIPSAVNVMTTTTTTFSSWKVHSDWIRIDPQFSIKRETKRRQVSAPDGTLPNIAPGRPMIDAHRLGIILSVLAHYV
ncbi:MAG: putative maturation protein [Wruxavirus humenecus]|uniref:Maturation protein n=1 Tax=Leviviridae sp. TaxID=2027243 RepID=A0ABY4D970_9VIRU|nr:MAG: putative maturation protein [Leviviridae sp.]